MCHEHTPSRVADRATASVGALQRIAQMLGVPVSAFYSSTEAGKLPAGPSDLQAEALLTLVEVYLRQAGPEARARFVAAVRVTAEAVAR